LPAWNEALGLPRPWDQQWSLRMQQVLAFETDLLEYEDIFEGSRVIESRTKELVDQAYAEMNEILDLGGAFESVELLKGRLVQSMSGRTSRIEKGEQKVIGVNAFTETADSPLGGSENILKVDPKIEKQMIKAIKTWRQSRDQGAVDRALSALSTAAKGKTNLIPPLIELAKAGGTTGEWAEALRDVFGEFRAPTGVGAASGRQGKLLEQVAEFVKKIPGGPPRLLVAKPGLDGHSSGAEQIAVAARDSGMEVVYSGIRLTPEQIAASARDEDPDVVGLSILSGSHLDLVPEVVAQLRKLKVGAPVVVGGIIPESDQAKLKKAGVSAVYTPKDFDIARIMRDIAELAIKHRKN
ncbi:MAG: methylmalonyl-CoA mutase family protein, partial [Actinomycetota bacterium]